MEIVAAPVSGQWLLLCGDIGCYAGDILCYSVGTLAGTTWKQLLPQCRDSGCYSVGKMGATLGGQWLLQCGEDGCCTVKAS